MKNFIGVNPYSSMRVDTVIELTTILTKESPNPTKMILKLH